MSSHDRFRNRTGIFPHGLKLPTFTDFCMDNTYLSNAMANPVMVLSSTCGGNVTPHAQSQFTFARHPAGGRLESGKDGVVSTAGAIPFPSPFPVRPIYGQGEFLLPLQHPLLAGHALGRSYIHPGAFRPLTNLTDERNAAFHGSAFMPAKCMKLDGHSPGSDISSATQPLLLGTCFPGSGSESSFHQSPANSTASSLGQNVGSFLDGKDDRGDSDSMADGTDRMSETPNLSEESRSIERSTPEDRSTPKRLKKFFFDGGQTPFCPICLQTISLSELDAHFEMEKKRLDEEVRKCVSQQLEAASLHSPFSSPMCIVRKEDKGKPESRWENYQRVKSNRTTRLTSSRCLIKRKKWEHEDRSPEDNLNIFAANLRKRDGHDFSSETSLDSRTAAEFNWAVSARMQAIAAFQRNLSDFSARKFENPDDENQELNVDEDDSAMYGQPHYTEADVITCSSEDNADSKEQIRRIQSNDFNYQRHPDSNQWALNGGNGEGQEVTSTCVTNNDAGECLSPSAKVSKPDKDASDNTKDQVEDSIKCLICSDPFIKPVVSICCWHVHCEECWLKSLGTKKLCPQCNMITAAKDLRRIYL